MIISSVINIIVINSNYIKTIAMVLRIILCMIQNVHFIFNMINKFYVDKLRIMYGFLAYTLCVMSKPIKIVLELLNNNARVELRLHIQLINNKNTNKINLINIYNLYVVLIIMKMFSIILSTPYMKSQTIKIIK